MSRIGAPLQGIQRLRLASEGAGIQVPRTHSVTEHSYASDCLGEGAVYPIDPARSREAVRRSFRAQPSRFLIGPVTTRACVRAEGGVSTRRRRDGGGWGPRVCSLATWRCAVPEQVWPGGRLLGQGSAQVKPGSGERSHFSSSACRE